MSKGLCDVDLLHREMLKNTENKLKIQSRRHKEKYNVDEEKFICLEDADSDLITVNLTPTTKYNNDIN